MSLCSSVRARQRSHTTLIYLGNAREDKMALSSALAKSWSSSLERGAVVVSTHDRCTSAQDSQPRDKVHKAHSGLAWFARFG